MAELIDRSSLEYQTRMTFSFWGMIPIINRIWAFYKERDGNRIVRSLNEAIYDRIAQRAALRDSKPDNVGSGSSSGRLLKPIALWGPLVIQ
jgi:hypothetical protein